MILQTVVMLEIRPHQWRVHLIRSHAQHQSIDVIACSSSNSNREMFRLALTRLAVATTRTPLRSPQILTNRSRSFLRHLSSSACDVAQPSRLPLADINQGAPSKRMGVQFRCKECQHTLRKTFTRQSYEHGIVIIRCDSCSSLHLIADNLGWFNDLTQDGKFK